MYTPDFRCTEQCPPGRYGNECERDCNCLNGGTCDPITGVCICLAGWRGALCEEGNVNNTDIYF